MSVSTSKQAGGIHLHPTLPSPLPSLPPLFPQQQHLQLWQQHHPQQQVQHQKNLQSAPVRPNHKSGLCGLPPTFNNMSLTSFPSRAFAKSWVQIDSTSTPAAFVSVESLSDVISRPSSARMRAA